MVPSTAKGRSDLADDVRLSASPLPAPAPDVEQNLQTLDSLLDRVEAPVAAAADEAASDQASENRLVASRLGIAGSLFAALQAKHAGTASHSMRVALGCSAWAIAMGLTEEECDAIEVAALLHDIGKVGVADRVLLKPGPLSADEEAIMDRHWQMGLDILSASCNVPEVIDIVRHASGWFDGSRRGIAPQGAEPPRTARMLAIIDAFDSMTTAQVYRPAMSADAAIQELCDCAGTQFDPELVNHYVQLYSSDQQKLQHRVARRWLQDLKPENMGNWWQLGSASGATAATDPHAVYAQRLLENMYDAVMFFDSNMQVALWNRGAERLTGIGSGSILQRPFLPTLVEMRDERGMLLTDEDCPVLYCVRTGVQSLRRLTLRGREGREVTVDAHCIPVLGADGVTLGASVLMHDASGQASLEERCQSLYEQATRDPLTQLANRAEFDRVFSLFVNVHLERKLPCSLIMCDIDHFKLVNDNFGHQAGDEAIKGFAQLLKSACRPGDLVARYGGEEFVILCADCTNSIAAARGEELRKAFSTLPIPMLNGKNCTASFGVTEIQAGDTAETMLNRADRALLMAKEGGRNLIVQLGSGMRGEPKAARRSWWKLWSSGPSSVLIDRHLSTNVPLNITLQKLSGFVSDHSAEIISITGDRVLMTIHPAKLRFMRRASDRPVPMIVELDFVQRNVQSKNAGAGTMAQTNIHAIIRPKRNRDRRRPGAVEHAQRVLAGLKSYLMANELVPEDAEGMIKKASSLLSHWRGKRQ